MKELSTLPHPARIVAIFRTADLPVDASVTVGLALWHVADPGNVGTLVRTCDALGPAFQALSRGCADPTSPKALRASAGAIFRVPLRDFEQAPRPRIALVPRAAPSLSTLVLGESATFVLGAERLGLPADIVHDCDETASIPVAPSAESLNVAAAGAIALYERRRRL